MCSQGPSWIRPSVPSSALVSIERPCLERWGVRRGPKVEHLITLCDHLSHILLANVWHTGHITVTILAWC